MTNPAQRQARERVSQPSLQNGLLLWRRPSTIIVHLLWLYQFVLALIAQYFIILLLFSTRYHIKLFSDGVSVTISILNVLFGGLIIVEICLYANLSMTTNIYLGAQFLKLIYVFSLYGVAIAWKIRRNADLALREDVWQDIWISFVFLTPYVASLIFAIVLKAREKRKGMGTNVIVTVTPAEGERRPLLRAPVR